jgi:hypothetical protein
MDDARYFETHYKDFIKQFGRKIIVHKNYGKTEHTQSEILGSERPRKNNSDFSYFDFLKTENIEKGDILQNVGENNLWKIVDIDDGPGFLSCKTKKLKER